MTPALYEIVVRGELGDTVGSAFEDMHLDCASGLTTITGYVEDQAQLAGLLRRVSDLGLDLVSVGPVAEQGAPTANGVGAGDNESDAAERASS